jgi:hypothetical protein
MFELVGHRTDHEYGYGGWTGETTDVEEILATFDDEKAAEQYIQDALLAKWKKTERYGRGERPFKQKSLLCNFTYGEVREISPDPPHNPVL